MTPFGFFLETTPRAHSVPDVAEVSTCPCKVEVTEAQQVRGDQTRSFLPAVRPRGHERGRQVHPAGLSGDRVCSLHVLLPPETDIPGNQVWRDREPRAEGTGPCMPAWRPRAHPGLDLSEAVNFRLVQTLRGCFSFSRVAYPP